MEPVTMVVVGVAAWGWLRSRYAEGTPLGTEAAGTSPTSPLANTTTRVGIPIGTVMETPPPGPGEVLVRPGDQLVHDTEGNLLYVLPADLAARLDDETAMMLRDYVALNPPDFQSWLDRYARFIVLRNDMHLEKIADPPEPDTSFQPTPAMLARMGNAAYKIGQAINGVAVGKSVDIFGVAASAAGAIPGMNQDMVSAIQASALTYNAIQAIAALNGVSINLISGLTGGAFLGTVTAAAYPGLAGLSVGVQALGPVLMAVGLVVDIGFTVIGNKPDLQKAIDVALDVASLVCLFIPVIGWVIAIVIQLVKFIIDLFGDDLFGGGASHEEREALETATYGANLNPMFPQIANAYTPRELLHRINEWGSGVCGGRNIIAMAVTLDLKVGDVVTIAGAPYTVPANVALTYPYPGCYALPQPYRQMTFDELAWAMAVYAPINGVRAMAQAGIADALKVQFNEPTRKLIMARAGPMRDFLVKYHLTLDDIDMIAMEYRAQPHLHTLARFFGWHVVNADKTEGSWQAWFATIVYAEWGQFNSFATHGTLGDFAKANGFPTMFAFRVAALKSWETFYTRVQPLANALTAIQADYATRLEEAQHVPEYGWGIG